MSKPKPAVIISSAAEYLTYISAAGEAGQSVEIRYEEDNLWLTQRKMAELYGVDIASVNQHIKKIYADNELIEDSTIKNFLIVQNEGSRQVSREVSRQGMHYNLRMIVSVGLEEAIKIK